MTNATFNAQLNKFRRLVIEKGTNSRGSGQLKKAILGEGYGTWEEDPNWMIRYYMDQAGYQLTGDGVNTFRTQVDPTDQLQKAALTTADAGAYNIVYGAVLASSVAQKPGTYAAVPKNPHNKSGWRLKSAAIAASGIGVAQGAALGTGGEATFREVGGSAATAGPTLKTVEKVADVSDWMMALTGDDAVKLEEVLKDLELSFFKSLNADMHVDITTVASNNFESVDRWTGETNLVTEGLADATDEDLHGIDRSANAWFDAWALSNSGTDRNVSVSLINQLYQNVMPYWPDTGFENGYYITGQSTHRRWSELEESKQRYAPATYSQDATMGIGAATGVAAGLKLGSWDSMPIVVDDSVGVDTIARIYLLHKQAAHVGWALPPTFRSTDDPLISGHVWRGVMWGMGEAICLSPFMVAQLRDLQ